MAMCERPGVRRNGGDEAEHLDSQDERFLKVLGLHHSSSSSSAPPSADHWNWPSTASTDGGA
jgi:hypothetical protein